MKPNLAFGPIDSVTQYLLYLSVVVLGVLLPFLLQKWRTHRENTQLLRRTLVDLAEEFRANRRRVSKSRETYERALTNVQVLLDHYTAQAESLLRGETDSGARPPDADVSLSLPLTARVAWDVARLAGALALVPRDALAPYAKAFQLQDLWERDRALLLELAMQLETLDLPADFADRQLLHARLALLTRARATLRYHVGLADMLLSSYAEALNEPQGVAA
jgi:hypothetical protein